VVSNYHVVGDATDIRVVLHDRREFDGKVLLADPSADLAFVQLTGAAGLPALALADSDAAEVGDLVLAIGNPFGVGQTVTGGIVSALARGGGRGQAGYLVQTDAAINPGNSGGALVDVDGRLLGINTSILSRSGGAEGIGFAIPANLVAAYLAQVRAGAERFVAPWSGLALQPVDAEMAQALELATPQGVMVTEVHTQSPFAAAGVRAGDVLMDFDGAALFSPADLDFRLSLLTPGKRVPATLMRGGKQRSIEVTISEAPDIPPPDPRRIGGRSPFAGLEVSNLNPRVAQALNLPYDAGGVAVTGVDGPAQRLGLRPGDVLVEINGQTVTDTRTLEAIAARAGVDLRLRILREGRELGIRLVP